MKEILRVEGLHKAYRRMAPGFRLRTLKSALLEGTLVGGLGAQETVAFSRKGETG